MSQLAQPLATAGPTPGPYFKLDLMRMNLREFWRRTRRPGLFLTLAAMKLLGMKVPATHLVPHIDLYQSIPPARVPEPIRQRWAGASFALRASGFAPAASLGVSAPGEPGQFVDLHLSADRLTMAVVRDARPGARQPVEVDLATPLAGDRILLTLDHPPNFDPPPWTRADWRPGAPTPELIARHEARRAQAPDARPIDPNALDSSYREMMRRWFRHLVGRGVLLQAKPEEVARALEAPPAPTPGRRAGR